MNIDLIIIISIAALVIWSLYQKKQKEKRKAELSVDTPMDPIRQLMADMAPGIMMDYNVFTDSFLARFSDSFIRNGKYTNLKHEDVLDGIDFEYARWVYSRCTLLASLRCKQIEALDKMKEAEIETVELKVSRSNPDCPLLPVEKKLNINKAVIYPCADCKKEKPCDIWYKPID